MTIYAGLWLDDKRSVLSVLDSQGQVQEYFHLPVELHAILAALEPYQSCLQGVALVRHQGDYNLIYGLMEAGYSIHLLQPFKLKGLQGGSKSPEESAVLMAKRLRFEFGGKRSLKGRESGRVRSCIKLLRKRMTFGKFATQ